MWKFENNRVKRQANKIINKWEEKEDSEALEIHHAQAHVNQPPQLHPDPPSHKLNHKAVACYLDSWEQWCKEWPSVQEAKSLTKVSEAWWEETATAKSKNKPSPSKSKIRWQPEAVKWRTPTLSSAWNSTQTTLQTARITWALWSHASSSLSKIFKDIFHWNANLNLWK